MRILLVEDDEDLGDALATGLGQEGYAVDWFRDCDSAEHALMVEAFDLCVLDLGLPGRDGIEVLRTVRATGNVIPVLILTARDRVGNRIDGLDAGADDYLTKPFDMNELFARLRSLIRRAGGRASTAIIHGDIVLDPAARTVTRQGASVELSAREFAVLHTLFEQSGRVMTKDQLEQAIYSWDSEVESNTVEVYVHHLRRKLGADLIRTIRGVGYIVDRAR